MQNVCKEIECPYFCSNSKGYGCRRYLTGWQCHLAKDFQSNEYVLFAPNEQNLEETKAANIAFMKQCSKYQRDLELGLISPVD